MQWETRPSEQRMLHTFANFSSRKVNMNSKCILFTFIRNFPGLIVHDASVIVIIKIKEKKLRSNSCSQYQALLVTTLRLL